MSAPSITVSQTDFLDAMSRINVTSEPPSGCDTPVPMAKISDETLNTLNAVSSRLEASTSRATNPRKRKRANDPPNQEEPSNKDRYTDARDEYPAESKPIYLKLKGLHKKKLSLASNIKVMEGKLAKNQFPTSVDFRFNINSTRNPVLKDVWARAIRKCKTDLTLALIDDLQKTYNRTKAAIAKELSELETLLSPGQFKEIKDSLSTKFKQMAPLLMERKQNQFRGPKGQPKRKFNAAQKGRQQGKQRGDPKVDRLLNTLKALLK